MYSNKAFAEVSSREEQDVLNYIQGVSAIKKKFLKKALQNFHAISNSPDFKNLKNLKLGQLHLMMENYDEAISYYLKWEDSSLSTNKVLKKNGYHNLGLSYLHKKDYKNAKKYFDKELKLVNDTDTLEIITNKMELANVYYNQYLDETAIPLFVEAYQLAKSFSNIELKQNTSKNLAVVEKNRENFKESVDYYIEYNKWKDSIWNADKIWELTERDKQLAIARKQQEIALQNEKLKRQNIQRKGLVIGASGLLIFIGFLGYFYKKLIKKNKLIITQREELEIANKTKDYLFSVVSHDLRSPINTLKKVHNKLMVQIENEDMLGMQNTANTAIEITEDTFHLLNNVLHWSLEQNNQLLFEQGTYPLQQLVEQTLINFEGIIETKEITLLSELDNEILVNVDKESLKIILRNLFDNAIKYTEEKGTITVKTGIVANNQCYIEIADTGIGIPEERLLKINALRDITIDKIDRSKGVGLGLLLCQTLIKKNKGSLLIESELNKGTKIKVLLPWVSA
ncbi:tetratricopeptide repeat-containing sensor histidine kinase [Aquimarina gracilis]|uniref:histidine kinase n=1 Tax=Aquimarina gracilis TaxID=874422 RepID=A0ABU5ZRA4_9FLAO|nr:tetratricopeptide repeat-containing sensor histidine kinase [Aquimarina gracilis]MEB3344605.1 tetratricopeptide repeat-containing sensor histidine kinase [Aquimarina gracilis]